VNPRAIALALSPFLARPGYRVAAVIAAVALVLAAILVAFVYALRRQVRLKTRELNLHIKQLQASERRNRAFIAALPDLFFTIDRDGTYLDCDVPSPELLRSPPGGLIGRNLREVFEPELAGLFLDSARAAIDTGIPRQIEYELEVPAGLRHFECRIAGLDANTALYVARDVTERYLHEDEMRRSLAEKEILLREVHHRVKNNLQIISSLVALQADQFRDPADWELMQETQQRIHSIAQLHELLYESKDFASIEVDDLVAGILDGLAVTFHAVSRKVEMRRSIAPATIKLETAVPVGLIVNELATNSLKYAFSDGRGGTLAVTGGPDGADIVLVVKDDGPGLPIGVDFEDASTLGFVLVRSLARQVRGTVRPLRGPGAQFELRFPAVPSPRKTSLVPALPS